MLWFAPSVLSAEFGNLTEANPGAVGPWEAARRIREAAANDIDIRPGPGSGSAVHARPMNAAGGLGPRLAHPKAAAPAVLTGKAT
jgi:hypothetical protein